MTDETEHPAPAVHRPTLMTVHAHPDDETIGTGGAMARAVADGRRVVLVTCTRGELGEIVVPDMDTRGQPPASRGDPGRRARAGDGPPRRHRVGEPRLSRLRDDGHGRQPRPALVLAGGPRRGGRPADLARAPLPAGRHDDLQPVRRLRAPRSHPDPRRRGPRLRPGGRPGVVSGPARGAGAHHVGAVQALRAGHPGVRPDGDGGTVAASSASGASGSRPRTRRPSRSPSSRSSPRR